MSGIAQQRNQAAALPLRRRPIGESDRAHGGPVRDPLHSGPQNRMEPGRHGLHPRQPVGLRGRDLVRGTPGDPAEVDLGVVSRARGGAAPVGLGRRQHGEPHEASGARVRALEQQRVDGPQRRHLVRGQRRGDAHEAGGERVQGRGLAEQERPRPAVAAVGAHEHGAARLGAVCESGHDPVVRGGEGRERFAPADVQARREQRAEPGAVEPLARARGDYVSRLQGLEVEEEEAAGVYLLITSGLHFR